MPFLAAHSAVRLLRHAALLVTAALGLVHIAIAQERGLELNTERDARVGACADAIVQEGEAIPLDCSLAAGRQTEFRYRWDSLDEGALELLSSTTDPTPIFRAPARTGRMLRYVFVIYTENSRGEMIGRAEQTVIVQPSPSRECAPAGDVPLKGNAGHLCGEMAEFDGDPGTAVVPPGDVSGERSTLDGREWTAQSHGLEAHEIWESGPFLRCPLSVTAASGEQMSLACISGAGGAGLLEYAAEFDWPPYAHAAVMEDGEFDFRIAVPDITGSAGIRTVRLTATDPASGLTASASVQIHVVDQSPEITCEDLTVTEGEAASFACVATSRTGEDLVLQYLPQVHLRTLPWGIFEDNPSFTAPEVTSDTTVVITVRALDQATRRVVERTFTLTIEDASGPGFSGAELPIIASADFVSCGDQDSGINEIISSGCKDARGLLDRAAGARGLADSGAGESPQPSNARQPFSTSESAALDGAPEAGQEMGSRESRPLRGISDGSWFGPSMLLPFQILCVNGANGVELNEGIGYIERECYLSQTDATGPPVPASDFNWSSNADSGNDGACPALSLRQDSGDQLTVYVGISVGEVALDTQCAYTITIAEDVATNPLTRTQGFDFTIINIVKPVNCVVDNNGRAYAGGAPVNISCTIGNPAPGASYSWSYVAQNSSNPALSNNGSGSFTFTPPATIASQTDYTYTISAVNAGNNEAATPTDVTITVLPLSTISSVSCQPSSWTGYEGDPDVSVSCSPVTSNGETVSWSWAPTGSTTNLNQLSGAGSPAPTFHVPGNVSRDTHYEYAATVTANGHEDSGTAIGFTVLNNRTITLLCEADEATVYPGDPDVAISCSATGEPGVTDFDWAVTPPGGATFYPASGPSIAFGSGVPTTYSGTGSYTFVIEASRTRYDNASASVTITVAQRPTISISCPDDPIEVFVGDPDISLGCSVTNSAGLILTWSWSPSTRLSSASTSSPTFDVPNAGESWSASYSYTVTISNDDANPSSDSDVLTVNIDQHEGLFVSCPDLELYDDDGDLVLDQCQAGGAAEGRSLSYSWSGQHLTGASSATPTFQTPEVEQDTEFPISVTVSDGVTLPASDEFTITVLDRPILALACDGDTHTAFEDDDDFAIGCEATGLDSGISYDWQGPTSLLSSASVATPLFQIAPIDADETYEFTLTASAENAVSAVAGITVNIIANAILTVTCEQYHFQRFEGENNVEFDCSAEGAPEGSFISWEWEPAGSTQNLANLLGASTEAPTFVVPASVDRNTVFAYRGTASAPRTDDAVVEISVTVLDQGSLIVECDYEPRVNEGSGQIPIECSASGAPDPGAVYSWAWSAASGTPLDNLSDVTTASPFFAVPADVPDDTRFEYGVRVSADNASDGEARVVITVLDAKALALPCDGAVYEAYEGEPDFDIGCEATGLREGAEASYAWDASQEALDLLGSAEEAIRLFRVPIEVAADQRYEYSLTVSAQSSVAYTATLTVLVKDSEALQVLCDPEDFSRYEGGAPVALRCSADGAPDGADYTWAWEAVGGADIDLLSGRGTATPTFNVPASVEETAVHEYRATVSARNSADGHVTVRATVINNATLSLACDGEQYYAFEGDLPLQIGCEAEGGPEGDYMYEWTSPEADNLEKLSDTNIAAPQFAVDAEVDADKTYNYGVRVTATGADPLEARITVTVLDSRPITLTCASYEFDLYEGDPDLEIGCEASGWPETASPTYAWMARGATAGTELLSATDAATTTFLVPDAVDADETYEYRLSVSAEHSVAAEADITVRVLNKARLALVCDPQNHSVYEGEADFSIACTASGAPDPAAAYQFIWTSRGPASHLERLSNAGSATTDFLVPAEVASDSLFEYAVTASAEHSDDVAADVTVTVRNRPPLVFEETIPDQLYVVSEAIMPLSLPSAAGGAPPYAYELAPAPPEGIEFDTGARLLRGTPRRVMARTPYTWTATDTRGKTATLEFAIEVLEEPPLIGSLTGLTVSTTVMRLGAHLTGALVNLDPNTEQATTGLAGVVQTGRMMLLASDSVDLDIELRSPAILRNTSLAGMAGRVFLTPRATLSASCTSLSSEAVRGTLTRTLLLDGECHLLRFGGDVNLADAEPGTYVGNIDVLLREDAAEEIYRIPVELTVEAVRRVLTIGPGLARLDETAGPVTSLSEEQAMSLYPTVAVLSAENRQGTFEVSNPSLVPLEVSVAAEFGYGAAPVAANTAIMPGEVVTDTSASDLGDLSDFVAIYPGVLLLNPGESAQVRFEIREEGLPALEQKGHAMVLNFVSRPRQFVNARELPEVQEAPITGEVLTQVFGVYVPERAPSQIFVRRVTAPGPPFGDRSVTLVLETADLPFYGDVVLLSGNEEVGRARALVFTRSQIRVPVSSLPTEDVLVRFEPSHGVGAPPVQRLLLTP